MARVREMQGTPARIIAPKFDGNRRHPSYCIFVEGSGENRICTNPQCPLYYEHCKSAAKCLYYEKK
jgi:hypothetical protein